MTTEHRSGCPRQPCPLRQSALRLRVRCIAGRMRYVHGNMPHHYRGSTISTRESRSGARTALLRTKQGRGDKPARRRNSAAELFTWMGRRPFGTGSIPINDDRSSIMRSPAPASSRRIVGRRVSAPTRSCGRGLREASRTVIHSRLCHTMPRCRFRHPRGIRLHFRPAAGCERQEHATAVLSIGLALYQFLLLQETDVAQGGGERHAGSAAGARDRYRSAPHAGVQQIYQYVPCGIAEQLRPVREASVPLPPRDDERRECWNLRSGEDFRRADLRDGWYWS